MAIPLTRRLPQTANAAQAVAPRTPAQLAWRQLRKHRMALVGGAILILLYSMSLFADFIAPYTLDSSDRAKFYHPPTIPRFIDGAGRLHWRPFVYDTPLVGPHPPALRQPGLAHHRDPRRRGDDPDRHDLRGDRGILRRASGQHHDALGRG